jgi:hypothetical protein
MFHLLAQKSVSDSLTYGFLKCGARVMPRYVSAGLLHIHIMASIAFHMKPRHDMLMAADVKRCQLVQVYKKKAATTSRLRSRLALASDLLLAVALLSLLSPLLLQALLVHSRGAWL